MVGTSGSHRDLLAPELLQDQRQDRERLLEHERGADLDAHQRLVEAVVEPRAAARSSTMSEAALSRYVVLDVAAVTMFWCVIITPFGRPVDPEV